MVGHRLAEETGAAEGVAKGLRERGQNDLMSLSLAGFRRRQQKLDRRHVRLGDARAVDLEGVLPVHGLAHEVIDAPDGRDAAVCWEPKRPLRLDAMTRH